MLVDTFESGGPQVQITIDKCVIKRKQWLLQLNQIKTIRSNESSRNPRKFHVKQFHRWPGVQRHHRHGHCMEWWMFIHRMPTQWHRMHRLITPFATMQSLEKWARNRKNPKVNQSHPKINQAQTKPHPVTTGKIVPVCVSLSLFSVHAFFTISLCVCVCVFLISRVRRQFGRDTEATFLSAP